MSELKPCPFCGGEAKLHHVGNMHTKKRVSVVECQTFGCFGLARVGALKHDFEWMDEKVIDKWNTRNNEAFKLELIEAIEGAVDSTIWGYDGDCNVMDNIKEAIDEVIK